MCRWLLMSHDRVGANEFPLTHEFLAQMLGVCRPTLTAVAGALQKAGLINYHRGRITIINRKGLEAACCECYEVVAKALDRLQEAVKQMQETQMSFNLQYLQLQNTMQNENRQYAMVSNIMKTKHDTVKNSISNIR